MFQGCHAAGRGDAIAGRFVGEVSTYTSVPFEPFTIEVVNWYIGGSAPTSGTALLNGSTVAWQSDGHCYTDAQ